MKYTSLSHWKNGYNVQHNWYAIEQWINHQREDEDVVWSRLFEQESGRLIRSYFKGKDFQGVLS